jgi:hypothetical protein
MDDGRWRVDDGRWATMMMEDGGWMMVDDE